MVFVKGDFFEVYNMTIEKKPFEDVFPIEHGDFPASFQECSPLSFFPKRDVSLPKTQSSWLQIV